MNLSPGELTVKLKDVPVEYLLYIFSVSEDDVRRKISEYLRRWRYQRPEITGKDLIELGLKPGPVFGEILRSLQIAKIEKGLKNRDEELHFLREKYPELFARKKN